MVIVPSDWATESSCDGDSESRGQRRWAAPHSAAVALGGGPAHHLAVDHHREVDACDGGQLVGLRIVVSNQESKFDIPEACPGTGFGFSCTDQIERSRSESYYPARDLRGVGLLRNGDHPRRTTHSTPAPLIAGEERDRRSCAGAVGYRNGPLGPPMRTEACQLHRRKNAVPAGSVVGKPAFTIAGAPGI